MASREKCDRSVAVLEPDIEIPAVRWSVPEDSAQPVEIVSVSLSDEDHSALERCLDWRWVLHRAFGPEEGIALVRRRRRTPVAVCEADAQPAAWKTMLAQLASLQDPPLLIVSSHNPNAQLWAEALNLGAYDVLAKPYDRAEVSRVLHSAWARWKDCHTYRPAAHKRHPIAAPAA